MNHYILLCLSLLACLAGGVFRKIYTLHTSGNMASIFLFNAVSSIVSAGVLLLWGVSVPSAFTIWLGILFGVVTALQSLAFLWALQIGPMSYTSVIGSFSTLVTAVSGVLFFDEGITVLQTVGIAIMLCSFVFAAEKDKDKKKSSFLWLLLCTVNFLSIGCIGIMQKVHQSSPYRAELNSFLVIAFVVAGLLSLFLALLFFKSTAGEKKNKSSLVLLLLCMLAAGVGAAFNNKFNLYLSGVIDSAVFFPVVNGGGLILSTLAAVVFFKERLAKKQWIGMVLGIVAVLMLCTPT
ncbi:MAG: hypothetical protein E7619_01635 [Ruminococcaceae bacterium]|nr:hypothetical protein [Oscillospiraceae bacterium]